MRESIWTRERKLKEEEEFLLTSLRMHYKSLHAELDNDDWDAAKTTAVAIQECCIRQKMVERELENVTALCDGWERIEKRMDELEKASGKA